jgi:hypothetical protein
MALVNLSATGSQAQNRPRTIDAPLTDLDRRWEQARRADDAAVHSHDSPVPEKEGAL